mgnify:CR=1 FL=1
MRVELDLKYKDLITADDIAEATRRAITNNGGTELGIEKIYLTVDSDGYLASQVTKVPFKRIRRITGYLVGDTDMWNDAKQKELSERVKHSNGKY